MKLYASGEDYLEAVLVLQRKQGMVRSIDLARHMGFSKPSISHAVDLETAEQEACRIEHAISDTSFRKLKEKVQGTD